MEEKDQTVIETTEEVDDDIDFEDFNDDEDETSADASKKTDDETETEEKKQNRQKNHEQAKARRERELKAAIEKARKEGYDEAIRKSKLDNNKENTFTGQPIEDEYDLTIYELQKKIEEDGGDPIRDLPKYIAKSNRDKDLSKKQETEKQAKQKEQFDKEYAEFKAKYPDLDYGEVLKEGSPFRNYADGKIGGKKSIAQVYKEYEDFTNNIIENKKSQKTEEDGKNKSKMPSSSSSGSTTKPKKVEEMSDEEFIKYYKGKYGSF